MGLLSNENGDATSSQDIQICSNIQNDIAATANKDHVSELNASHTKVDQLELDEAPRGRVRSFVLLIGLFVSISPHCLNSAASKELKNLEERQDKLTFLVQSTIFTAALNVTIIATAVPTICAELKSAAGYSWIGGAYLLANAAAGPIWAKVSDIWGRKLILLIAVAMYFVASLICALSINMNMLIAGRAIQGAVGGGLTQMVSITISDLFSIKERALYVGLFELMWVAAGGIGPVLGGTFTQYASWRWCFWINLPLSGITFLLLFLFLDVHNPRTGALEGLKAVDWFGSASILGFMVMLLLGLNFGGETVPWDSPTVICLIVFGALMSICFVLSEKHLAEFPLMPMGLFQNKSNIACFVITFGQSFAVSATEYYLPLYFQSAKLATPTLSGVLILPVVLGAAATAIFAGLMIHRTGQYSLIIKVGVVLQTLGCGLLIHLTARTSLAEVIIFELITGIGAGLLFSPPLIALQTSVSQEDTATAIGTLGFIMSLALALAVIISGVVFQNGMQLEAPKLEAAGLPQNITGLLYGNHAAANVEILKTIQDPLLRSAAQQAYAWSLRNVWILCTCAAGLGVVASVFIVQVKLSSEHTETRTGLLKKKEKDASAMPATSEL